MKVSYQFPFAQSVNIYPSDIIDALTDFVETAACPLDLAIEVEIDKIIAEDIRENVPTFKVHGMRDFVEQVKAELAKRKDLRDV